jgi:hypothetical protein
MLTLSTWLNYDVDIVNIMSRKIWFNSPPLAAVSLLMFVVFLCALAGMYLDPRTITGAPAWLKPAKFGISTTIYAGTLAWLFGDITVWPRFKRAMGAIIAAVLVVEVAIIDVQAARGTASHFNVGTLFDATLWGIMAVAILVLWLASMGIVVALFRQRFADPAWGWALRLGMLISVIGAGLGGVMTRPTPAQVESLARHEQLKVIGAHTVGAPDGGPGLPVAGWSAQHGDLRIPHFFGLHGLQIIPLFAWLIQRRRTPAGIFVFAGGYLTFIALLTWQALAGRPVLG